MYVGKRKTYLDIIRILAIFMVLFAHTGTMGNKLYTVTPKPILQVVYCAFECFRTINNPLLFMISGALLLGKDETISELFRKRILRFVVVLVLFSIFVDFYQTIIMGGIADFSISNSLVKLVKSPVKASYWYLYYYISFLVMLPFIRAIARNIGRIEMLYLIIVMIIVNDGFLLIKFFSGIASINFSVFIDLFIPFYPICGYYFDVNWKEMRNKKIISKVLLFGAMLSLIVSVFMTILNFRIKGSWTEEYISCFDVLLSIWVFVTFKDLVEFVRNDKVEKILRYISSMMFGIYLLEDIVMRFTMGIYYACDRIMPAMCACFVWLMCAVVLGILVVSVLKKIPVFRKLL